MSKKLIFCVFVTLLFHVSGFIGLQTNYQNWFIQLTPLNILICTTLLIFSHQKINNSFLIFGGIVFFTGLIVEIIGVNTSLLFGNYKYSKILGISVKGVPLLMGALWFNTIYCIGTVVNLYIEKLNFEISDKIKKLSVLIDGALLCVLFDFLIEPVAIKLNFWQWQNNIIPFKNYLCWFIISILLLEIFRKLSVFNKNYFALHLLLIQSLFFLGLRLFL